MSKLLFQTWQTVIEPAFWGTLGDYKLQTLKLDEGPLDITATYKPSNHPQVPGVLSLEPSSLNLTTDATAFACPSSLPHSPSSFSSPSPSSCTVHGQIYCVNTVERVTSFDRQAVVAHITSTIWNDILTGRALEDPSLLQRMIALVYCDLKLYKYHYWLGFPVLSPPVPYTLHSAPQTVEKYLTSGAGGVGSRSRSEQVVRALETYYSSNNTSTSSALSLLFIGDDRIECQPLTAWQQLSSEQHTESGVNNIIHGLYLVCADTSNTAEYPGWSLRNALLLAAVQFKAPLLRVLCLRTSKGMPSAEASIVFEVNLPTILEENYHPGAVGGWDTGTSSLSAIRSGPRVADLGALMDPRRLASSAVDLNLQLMRWRAAPSLDTTKIAQTRCLLLGAGTLGCSVARCLLGWGVRKITFVDSAKVAYSNPVRQSLFEFQDCLHGGKPKAIAAAEAVKRIFPDVDATGVEMNIPMPGHPPHAGVENEIRSVLESTEKLGKLIDEHDVVFMLLDTRESRWLGTVMCAAAAAANGGGADKLAITAALGFESFVAMRHGASVEEGVTIQKDDTEEKGKGERGNEGEDTRKKKKSVKLQQQQRLGCYFCSDVIAPANSTRDRTMDQQCTVARPGLSAIAGSLAVEVMAAVLQHPLGTHAPAAAAAVGGDQDGRSQGIEEEPDENEEYIDAPLGSVPHMIRGHLSGFSQTCLTGYAFPQCPACSPTVVEQYRSRRAEFVLQAVSQPRYLEDLTGLSELQRQMEEQLEEMKLQREREEEAAAEQGTEGGGEEDEDADWEEL